MRDAVAVAKQRGVEFGKCLTVNIDKIMSTIKIKQTRSAINRPANQKATIQALGFKKLNQEIVKRGNTSNFRND
jgi:ribosomal protein L30